MQLAELGEHGLRPEHQTAPAAGVVVSGAFGHHAQRIGLEPAGGERGDGIGAGIEHVDLARRLGPMPLVDAADPDAGRGDLLRARLRAEEARAKLEQRDVGQIRGSGYAPRRSANSAAGSGAAPTARR